jgi:hypothetical protein
MVSVGQTCVYRGQGCYVEKVGRKWITVRELAATYQPRKRLAPRGRPLEPTYRVHRVLESELRFGDLCTYHIGSDSYGGVVVERRNGGRTIIANVGHRQRAVFTRRKDGQYLLRGHVCGRLELGIAVTRLSREF